ncbi:MAG: EamA family transporter [Candidatus Magasanikbacteria bacterium]|nr:EamA family transporter [Candidatus Magasanikbacteria bacterium]
MLWIFIAFIEPILHAAANIFDNYFSNTLFNKISALSFFGAFTNILFLPLIFLFAHPSLPPLSLIPTLCAIGAIEVAYLYPYLKALQHGDTSVVAALFAVGKIFVPIFAYLIVHEKLQPVQYVGFFIIILASGLLSFDRKQAFKFNHSFYYMIICSLLLSIEAVLYKYAFTDVSWATGFIWPTFISFIIVFLLLIIPRYRRDVVAHIPVFKNNFKLFALEELITFGGSIGATYSISQISVTMQNSISSFQPAFVLLYAVLLKRLFPKIFKEQIDQRAIIIKIFLFIIMLLGVILIVK